MKKLKKDELAKSVKKFLKKKKLKASDYETEFVEKTCALLTTAFNKTYDVSNTALGSIEDQVGKIHEAIFREEAEAKASSSGKPGKKSKKTASKTKSTKAVKKAAPKKKATTKKKTAAKKTPTKKAAKKATKKVAKKATKKTVTRKKTAAKKTAHKTV